jgi:hypothetical protein
MNYIAFDQHWGQYEFIAVLKPGVTAADIIEWITTWGPQEGEGWEYGPGTEQPELWGELYELEMTVRPGTLSHSRDDTYIGEKYRFTDKDGVTHLLFKQPKLEFYFDYDEEPAWLRYGKAYFYPSKCENWEIHQEEYDNGKCPRCRNPSIGGLTCSSCLDKE